ncbi:MAG TPA: efflux RND transporter periplasmic adaptor subunit [Candidatus Hydrogenedentes bacterium]|nr:efflux RND transporter periplasmic adaptor subunit [Candidatus Hydrogenedentota bacterium]
MKLLQGVLAAAILCLGIGVAYYFVTADEAAPAHAGDEHGHAHDVDDEHAHGDHGDHGHDEGVSPSAHMSEAAMKASGLETSVAGPASLNVSVNLPGEIAINQNKIVHVVPRLSGVVRDVSKNLGDTVVKGDLLAVIDSRELADAKSEYLAALERRALAQTRHDREKDLFGKKISSEEEFLTAKQALAEEDIAVRSAEQKLRALGLSIAQVGDVRTRKDDTLTDYALHAPIDGTIIEKHMSIGEAVADDADAFVIADLSSVWVEVVVYAPDLKRVREGQKVTVESTDLGIRAEGVISYIGALVGQQTRTAKAVVELANAERAWRPGLFVSVALASDALDVPVAVSPEAVQTLRGNSVVFVKNDDHFEARTVQLGASDGKHVEIISGLNAGDVYVSKNSFLVKADIEKAGAAHDH